MRGVYIVSRRSAYASSSGTAALGHRFLDANLMLMIAKTRLYSVEKACRTYLSVVGGGGGGRGEHLLALLGGAMLGSRLAKHHCCA